MTGIEACDRRELRLDHRHVTFFFIGAVIVCAIFFALGFIVGRGQAYEASIKTQSMLTENSPPKSQLGATTEPAQKASPSTDDSVAVSRQAAALDSAGVKGKDGEVDYRQELDFYNAVKEQKVKENFHPAPEKAANRNGPGTTLLAGGSSKSVHKADGQKFSSAKLLSLQVAALSNSRDAENLAKILRSKGYPVFIVRPESGLRDKLIRIQVGPFKAAEEAGAIKAKLEREGYKPIVKR